METTGLGLRKRMDTDFDRRGAGKENVYRVASLLAAGLRR